MNDNKLYSLLKYLNITNKEIIDSTGISKSYLSRLENERSLNPRSSFYLKIKKFLLSKKYNKDLQTFLKCTKKDLPNVIDLYFQNQINQNLESILNELKEKQVYLFVRSFQELYKLMRKFKQYLNQNNLELLIFFPKDNIEIAYYFSEKYFSYIQSGQAKVYTCDYHFPDMFLYIPKKIIIYKYVISNTSLQNQQFISKKESDFYSKLFNKYINNNLYILYKTSDAVSFYQLVLQNIKKSNNGGIYVLEHPSLFLMDRDFLLSILNNKNINISIKEKDLLLSIYDEFNKRENIVITKIENLIPSYHCVESNISIFNKKVFMINKEEYQLYFDSLIRELKKHKSYNLKNVIRRQIMIFETGCFFIPRRYNLTDNLVYISNKSLCEYFIKNYKNEIKIAKIKIKQFK